MQILAKYTKREPPILAEVHGDYFVKGQIYDRKGENDLSGLQRAIDDMAEDGEVFKVAPPAKKSVLDPLLGGILASVSRVNISATSSSGSP